MLFAVVRQQTHTLTLAAQWKRILASFFRKLMSKKLLMPRLDQSMKKWRGRR
jgi:hypothetical protein